MAAIARRPAGKPRWIWIHNFPIDRAQRRSRASRRGAQGMGFGTFSSTCHVGGSAQRLTLLPPTLMGWQDVKGPPPAQSALLSHTAVQRS